MSGTEPWMMKLAQQVDIGSWRFRASHIWLCVWSVFYYFTYTGGLYFLYLAYWLRNILSLFLWSCVCLRGFSFLFAILCWNSFFSLVFGYILYRIVCGQMFTNCLFTMKIMRTLKEIQNLIWVNHNEFIYMWLKTTRNFNLNLQKLYHIPEHGLRKVDLDAWNIRSMVGVLLNLHQRYPLCDKKECMPHYQLYC